MKIILALTALAALAGCQTITVVNDAGPVAPSAPPSESIRSDEAWHNTGIFGLVDYDGPYALGKLCNGSERWSSITTLRGPAAAGAELGLAVLSNIPGPVGIAGTIASFAWDPLTLRWSCVKKS